VAAGLDVDDGVLVDEYLVSCDPSVSAIGDCARWRNAAGTLRRESVQNAADHARCATRRLLGHPEPYGAVPWFWSEQGVAKLQIVGVRGPGDVAVLRGDPATLTFSVFHFAGGRLTCVESIGRATDHLAGRRLLDSRAPLAPHEAADTSLDLRALAARRVAAAVA
jgi:3-phenylpropionate/trans-cinnamate dioxygenase ferredoxin reductase component